MADLNNLERIDKVVDEIVDLQADLKNDIEARDTKFEKYDKILEEVVNYKKELETKVNEFDKSAKEVILAKAELEAKIEANKVKIETLEKKFQDLVDTNNNLEVKLETKNAKITRLEARLGEAETKITDLEVKIVVEDSEKKTALVTKAEHFPYKNENLKRPCLNDDHIETHKKIKVDEISNLSYTDQPNDVQRALSILSLAANLKEFFLPALTSDPSWNLNFSYIPDFKDIENKRSNLLMVCSAGTILFQDSSLGPDKVKLFQNGDKKDERFVRLEFLDGDEFIYEYDKEKNIVKDGIYRYKSADGIAFGVRYFSRHGRNLNLDYCLNRYNTGEIDYEYRTKVKGKDHWKSIERFEFNFVNLTWHKKKYR